jgi:hypothetical protein
MDYKLKIEIDKLVKLGLSDDMATIIACANKGKPEMAESYLTMIEQEQQTIKEEIKEFKPFNESIIYNDKNEVSNIQH